MNKNDGTYWGNPIANCRVCIIFFLFYGQFQTYFMEIWALFLEIHHFRRPSFLCSNPLVKMDIPFGQNKHFGQVGLLKRSWFVVVSFNCRYHLMRVNTSHFTCVHLLRCAHDNEHRGTHDVVCNIFCCHCMRCQLPFGMRTITCISFNHVPFLSLTSWHCVHQR